jgi:hypothetical protein
MSAFRSKLPIFLGEKPTFYLKRYLVTCHCQHPYFLLECGPCTQQMYKYSTGKPYSTEFKYQSAQTVTQGVTKKCRLSWLTNSALVCEPKCRGRGGLRQLMNTAVHMEQTNFGDITPYLTYRVPTHAMSKDFSYSSDYENMIYKRYKYSILRISTKNCRMQDL